MLKVNALSFKSCLTLRCTSHMQLRTLTQLLTYNPNIPQLWDFSSKLYTKVTWDPEVALYIPGNHWFPKKQRHDVYFVDKSHQHEGHQSSWRFWSSLGACTLSHMDHTCLADKVSYQPSRTCGSFIRPRAWSACENRIEKKLPRTTP